MDTDEVKNKVSELCDKWTLKRKNTIKSEVFCAHSFERLSEDQIKDFFNRTVAKLESQFKDNTRLAVYFEDGDSIFCNEFNDKFRICAEIVE